MKTQLCILTATKTDRKDIRLNYNHALTKKLSTKRVSNEEFLKWLLTLVNLDIDQLSSTEKKELGKAWSQQIYPTGIESIKNLLTEFHEGLKRLIPADDANSEPGDWEFNIEGAKVILVRDPLTPIMQSSYRGDSRSVFLTRLIGILKEFGLRLNKCEECKSIFLLTKTDQTYCSNRCAIRVRQRRFYIAHKEEIKEKRRKNYEQTTQEKDAKHGKKKR